MSQPTPTLFCMPAKWQKGQFHHLHRFLVLNARTRAAVEGHYSKGEALRAKEVLDDTNAQNGHADRYEVIPLPEAFHKCGPERWAELLKNEHNI